MSIAGGLEKSIERAESIGCSCMQIFTKSNRQWQAKDLTKPEITAFKKACAASSTIKEIVAHASYLINIGSPDKNTNQKSVAALSLELQRCQELGIPYLVIHPGAHLTSSPAQCLEKIIETLNAILEHNPGTTAILLENTAGQGSTICSTLEQLATVYQSIHQKKRIGFCLDTCHAFAAGYDFRTKKTYATFWEQFDAILDIKNLKAIHINDSKKGLNSNVDRHEYIGKGALGLEAFRLIFNDKNLFDVPKILETPIEDMPFGYCEDMKTIRDLITPETRKLIG